MQSAKRIAAGPSIGPAGAAPGEAPTGGGPSLGTAGPGGRMRRLPGGRRRVVFVRLSPDEEAWIVPKAAAEGLSVQRFLVESAIPRGGLRSSPAGLFTASSLPPGGTCMAPART